MTEIGKAMRNSSHRYDGALPMATGGEKSWYAVRTKPRHEKAVAGELKEKGITVFLPLVSTIHQWSDRRQTVQLPLFASYAFVQIAPDQSARTAVLMSGGIRGFVGVRGHPVPIPAQQIMAIETVLRQRIPFTSIPYVDIGKKVRVRGGSLDGIEGIVLAINGDQSLVVSVEGVYKSLALRLSGYRVEAA